MMYYTENAIIKYLNNDRIIIEHKIVIIRKT